MLGRAMGMGFPLKTAVVADDSCLSCALERRQECIRMDLTIPLAVMIGGAIGTAARYFISIVVARF
jgi:hypothetical protein